MLLKFLIILLYYYIIQVRIRFPVDVVGVLLNLAHVSPQSQTTDYLGCVMSSPSQRDVRGVLCCWAVFGFYPCCTQSYYMQYV